VSKIVWHAPTISKASATVSSSNAARAPSLVIGKRVAAAGSSASTSMCARDRVASMDRTGCNVNEVTGATSTSPSPTIAI
jgi:hypothetical protein